MKTLGKILWHFPLVGFINALLCLILGGIFIATVAGAPLGRGLLQLSRYFLSPFSANLEVSHEPIRQYKDHWNVFGFYFRILYLPFGLVLFNLSLLQTALVSLTVVGFPAGRKLWRSLPAIFNPVNKVCVSTELSA